MATCPVCNHNVRTPFFLNLDAWTHLACPSCHARLEMKPPRSFLLAPIMAPLFVLARHGRVFETIAFVYMFTTFLLLFLECLNPKVRLRQKPPAKPSVRLNLNGPSE